MKREDGTEQSIESQLLNLDKDLDQSSDNPFEDSRANDPLLM